MKKFFTSCLVCILLVAGTISFYACNDVVTYHSISVTSSNAITGGTVEGEGNYKTNSTVTIKATAKENHTFFAWIKNDVVVSTAKNYKFVVSKETEGKYTAIFSTDELEYFFIDNATYDISNLKLPETSTLLPYEIKDLELSISKNGTIYETLLSIENQEIVNNDRISLEGIDSINRIVYVKKPGHPKYNPTYHFKLKIVYEYIDINTMDTENTITETIISNLFVDFSKTPNENGVKYESENYTIDLRQTSDTKTLILNFPNLESSQDWLDRFYQNLKLTLIYPFITNEETQNPEEIKE